MVFGTIFAIINGAAFPAQLTVFGELTTKFIVHEKQKNTKGTIDINDEMAKFAMTYAILGVISWIAGYIQCAFWSLSAIRQIHRVRLLFLESIMRQNIGWFDANEGGGITNRMFE